MPTDPEHIDYLLTRYIDQQSTAAETAELFDWIRDAPDPDLLRARVLEFWNDYQPGDEAVADFERLYANIRKAMPAQQRPLARINRLWRRTAAAAILILAGISAWLILKPARQQQPTTARATQQDIPAPNQVHAILTLSNGKKIILDSAANGQLASQGRVNIVKLADGQLAYKGTDRQALYNILTNPRGSRVLTLTLADGTKVWLNAASSLRYPTAFTGKTRSVDITGEAYFEVAKNAHMPFTVKKANTEIAVLGTSFNINSYDDESSIKITLIDGAVKVTRGDASAILHPGEQARVGVGAEPGVLVARNVDLEAVLAWKNGRFEFEGAGIREVMRQVSRWYDVDIQYQGQPIEQHFRGGIPRTADVSKIFTLLETTGAVHFKIDNKKIIVMP